MDVKHTLLAGGIERFSRDYTLDKKGTSISYCDKKDEFAPKPVIISWKKKENTRSHILDITTENDFSNAKQFVTEKNSIELTNLCMGIRYFCRITTEYIDNTMEEEVFSFQTEALPRTINIDGVSNTRDMGGYVTEDGTCRMKQDMALRGGRLQNITDLGRSTLLREFGIKTVLALNGETKDEEIVGIGPQYISVEAPWYSSVGSGIAVEAYKEALCEAVRVFADENRYPIYFHCTLGRDRTGTLAMLLSALCGIREQDIYLDYELSAFSVHGWEDEGDYKNVIHEVLCQFDATISYLKNYSDGNLMNNAARFMIDIGLSAEEINNIRNNLLTEC